MGFYTGSFNGNYTGYSVNSLDVFIWVLITAGAILFPVACFAYFCLKRQWQIRKLEQEYLYADPAKRKNLERGFLGPYAESKENVSNDDKPRTSNLIPEIIVQPYNLNNKVRFKDDPNAPDNQDQQNQLPALMTENYNPEMPSDDQNQAQDLRGLKNAVNFFGKNLANKKQNNYSNRSVGIEQQQQQLPTVPNSYSQNPIQPDVPIQQVYSQSNSQRSSIQPQNPVVYSVANSYAQQGIQANASSASNLVPDNIYSQVVPQRASRTNSQQQLPQHEEMNYSNSQAGAYDDEQPVYMNTGEVDQYTEQYSDQFNRNDNRYN